MADEIRVLFDAHPIRSSDETLYMGASLLMQIQTSFRTLGYPGLAILCFLAAAAGAFSLVVSIFVQDHKGRKK